MRLHPRTMLVNAAETQIIAAFFSVIDQHDLTYVELLQVVARIQARLLKEMLRDERHPGKPGARADEE